MKNDNLKCDKCGNFIQENELYEFMKKKVCSDCYIDLMVGVPDVDISKLPPEIQPLFTKVKKGWHRDRPNRHHYLRFNKA